MRWKLRTFLILVPILGLILALSIEYLREPPVDGTVCVLGPLTTGGKPELPLPSKDEINRAIQRAYQTPNSKVLVASIDATQPPKLELIESRISDERDYPLIGPARLHQNLYRCDFVLQLEDGTEAERSIIIDHNHFHVGM